MAVALKVGEIFNYFCPTIFRIIYETFDITLPLLIPGFRNNFKFIQREADEFYKGKGSLLFQRENR